MRITFLLGAGASRAAGLPCTNEITETVLSGKDVRKDTDGHYFIYADQRPTPGEERDIEECTKLATLVHSYVERYYRDRPTHPTNYESIAYILTQVAETISGEFDNPAIQALIDQLNDDPKVAEICDGRELGSLAEQAATYITDIAWSMVKREPGSTAHLKFLLGAREMNQDATYIFTLNHDVVLEKFLGGCKIPYADGFGQPKGQVRFWENALEPDGQVHFVIANLHGSVRWFPFDTNEGQVPVVPLGDPYHLRDEVGKAITAWPVAPRPVLLIGTFNKMYSYTNGVFADLHCCFHRLLRETSTLISVGYGFGDKGINTKLVQWLDSSKRRLVVVHPRPEELYCCARGAIRNRWQEWKALGKLVEVSKKAEETSWDEDLKQLPI
jgi:hypothetical protein